MGVDVEMGQDGHPSSGMGKGRITKVFMQEVSESLSSFLSVETRNPYAALTTLAHVMFHVPIAVIS